MHYLPRKSHKLRLPLRRPKLLLLPNQPKRKPKLSKILLGIDEVGRGPWAGPLVIGAVILNTDSAWTNDLTDSKQLTNKKREALNPIILEKSAATGLGWVSSHEIDKYGLSQSLQLATRRAMKKILAQQIKFDEIIIDGTINFLKDTPLEDRVTTLKKADLLIKEVSAASIIAKVARDRYMIDLANTYPEYGFEKHVGYGTALHKQALLEHGICPEHRRSFRPIREITERGLFLAHEAIDPAYPEMTTAVNPTSGQKAESVIAEYLADHHHTIIARNFKTKTYEIDIISIFENKIYFTEVKYRRSLSHGRAIAQIDQRKYQQIRYAAESFLHQHPAYRSLQPILAAGTVEGKDFTQREWLVLHE